MTPLVRDEKSSTQSSIVRCSFAVEALGPTPVCPCVLRPNALLLVFLSFFECVVHRALDV